MSTTLNTAYQSGMNSPYTTLENESIDLESNSHADPISSYQLCGRVRCRAADGAFLVAHLSSCAAMAASYLLGHETPALIFAGAEVVLIGVHTYVHRRGNQDLSKITQLYEKTKEQLGFTKGKLKESEKEKGELETANIKFVNDNKLLIATCKQQKETVHGLQDDIKALEADLEIFAAGGNSSNVSSAANSPDRPIAASFRNPEPRTPQAQDRNGRIQQLFQKPQSTNQPSSSI